MNPRQSAIVVSLMIFSSVLLVFAPSGVQAYTPEEGNINAVFGLTFMKTHIYETDTQPRSPNLRGMGLIATGDVNSSGALEIGLFYMPKVFIRWENGKYYAEQTDLVHITMGYRYWPMKSLSVSAAFFSSYSTGDVVATHDDDPSGPKINTSARDITEYGFDFSVQAELLTEGRFGLIIDGRYSLSVTKKADEHADHYGVLVGLRYLIQSKRSNPTSR